MSEMLTEIFAVGRGDLKKLENEKIVIEPVMAIISSIVANGGGKGNMFDQIYLEILTEFLKHSTTQNDPLKISLKDKVEGLFSDQHQ